MDMMLFVTLMLYEERRRAILSCLGENASKGELNEQANIKKEKQQLN